MLAVGPSLIELLGPHCWGLRDHLSATLKRPHSADGWAVADETPVDSGGCSRHLNSAPERETEDNTCSQHQCSWYAMDSILSRI